MYLHCMKTISFIIPTIGRDSLRRTLNSIEKWEGDEILVIQHNPPSGGWGNMERNEGIKRATCDYLAFIDDDDWYAEGHREIMDRAIKENPGKPILFRMQYPNGKILWDKPELIPGNVSTQMILVPNIEEMLHVWEKGRNMADFIFINKWKFPVIIWSKEIIAYLGHNDGEHA